MFEASAVFILQEDIKAFAVDLNDQRTGRLSKDERHLGERNSDCLSPNPFLLVIQDQLSSTFTGTRIEMKQDTVETVVIWSRNVSTEL